MSQSSAIKTSLTIPGLVICYVTMSTWFLVCLISVLLLVGCIAIAIISVVLLIATVFLCIVLIFIVSVVITVRISIVLNLVCICTLSIWSGTIKTNGTTVGTT